MSSTSTSTKYGPHLTYFLLVRFGRGYVQSVRGGGVND